MWTHALARLGSVSRIRSYSASSSSRVCGAGAAGAEAVSSDVTRCHRERKSFETPRPSRASPGIRDSASTGLPQIAHAASAWERNAPQRGHRNRSGSGSGVVSTAGRSATRSGVYCDPHIPHAVAPGSRNAPHRVQIFASPFRA